MSREKIRVPDLAQLKAARQPITMLTAYDYAFARIFDQAGIDVILVGDSLATTMRGEETTLAVTVDEVIYHSRTVVRARRRALVVADMPFLSYQVSAEDAVRNAGRLIKEGGAEAVKLEGGVAVADTIRRLSEIDIPVMGHIGLTPQSIHRMGGNRVQGRKAGHGPGCRERLIEDALAVEANGAFAIVIEGVPPSLAREITASLHVPTIGIGAGPDCDGQVLVFHDVVGLTRDLRPKFVRRYADLASTIENAARAFTNDVKSGAFPSKEESFTGARPTLRRVH